MAWRAVAAALGLLAAALGAGAQQPDARASFRVKYVADGAVYLDAGRAAGLAEGQKLVVRRFGTPTPLSGSGEVRAPRVVAKLSVISVAEASAVCEIQSSTEPIRAGDVATLVVELQAGVPQAPELAGARKYPQLIAFSEGDPLDEEAREAVPKRPLPEINRARGRVGVEYSGLASLGASPMRSTQVGLVLRMDMTRIAGTYWNFSGYWRGRYTGRSSGARTTTLNDLLNRTYHLGLTYNNPMSRWTAGFGRLYLPWASSLNTIDGGYLGRRIGGATTVGLFAGSTPDPTSWNYNPDRRIGGVFANFEGGSFESLRYTSTTGIALSTIRWRAERQFAFFENGLFYKRFLSIYHSLEADAPRTTSVGRRIHPGVSRSYLTVRVQPVQRLALDLNHNYFRDLPTFDSRLIGTGLLDNLLFQGFSGGARLDLPRKLTLYGSLGRSTRTGDVRSSWNQLLGVTLGEIWKTGIRADVRYSRFNSSFGRGTYRTVSFSRHFKEDFRWEVQAGVQNFVSPFTQVTKGKFVNTTLDWFLGPHFFLEGGFTLQRGNQQDYNQWFFVLGRRF